MSTISKKSGFVIPSPFIAIKAALKAIAESTTQSDVSNPLRPSLADQAAHWGIAYRDFVISIGEDSEDYSVVLAGCAYVGPLAHLMYAIDGWYSGKVF